MIRRRTSGSVFFLNYLKRSAAGPLAFGGARTQSISQGVAKGAGVLVILPEGITTSATPKQGASSIVLCAKSRLVSGTEYTPISIGIVGVAAEAAEASRWSSRSSGTAEEPSTACGVGCRTETGSIGTEWRGGVSWSETWAYSRFLY